MPDSQQHTGVVGEREAGLLLVFFFLEKKVHYFSILSTRTIKNQNQLRRTEKEI